MFIGLKRFFQRNKRKFFFTGGIIAFIYFGLGFLRQKLINYQLKLAEERFSREQIRRRFEQTQKDALFTIYSLVPVLCTPIFESLPVETITKLLQARRLEKSGTGVGSTNDDVSITTNTTSNNQLGNENEPIATSERKSKNELWSDLKSQSLTRLITLIYCNALLILFTRLQLNILSRRDYLEEAMKVAASKYGIKKRIELIDNTTANSTSTGTETYINEQAFLSFSWWLLNRGWIRIRERVQNSVDLVFKEIDPRAELSIDEFAQLIKKVQDSIENFDKQDEEKNSNFLSSVLLPPTNLEYFVIQQTLDDESLTKLQENPSNLRILLDETKNYISSESTLIVLSSLVNSGILTSLEHIAMAISNKQQQQQQKTALTLNSNNTNTSINSLQVPQQLQSLPESQQPLNEYKVKLAVLLANVIKASNEFKISPRNEFINNMDKVPELDEISASVYSNFD